jgi:predicted nucleic acid-binding protein
LLAAAAEEDGIAVASFDKDFDRLGIRRHDPGCDC